MLYGSQLNTTEPISGVLSRPQDPLFIYSTLLSQTRFLIVQLVLWYWFAKQRHSEFKSKLRTHNLNLLSSEKDNFNVININELWESFVFSVGSPTMNKFISNLILWFSNNISWDRKSQWHFNDTKDSKPVFSYCRCHARGYFKERTINWRLTNVHWTVTTES